jgi:hypothetical protein
MPRSKLTAKQVRKAVDKLKAADRAIRQRVPSESLFPAQPAHVLRGHVLNNPRYSKAKSGALPGDRTITILLDDGQKLKLKTHHMTVDVDVAVVIVEEPAHYTVQLMKTAGAPPTV